nr:polymorphic toxin-type HINT domain-containing protein [Streptomyces sp. PsTaAH-124]
MAFGIGTSRKRSGRGRRRTSGLVVHSLALALLIPTGLAQVAQAAEPGGLGRPGIPKPRTGKVSVFDGPGAAEARQQVAQDEKANRTQAGRAQQERRAAWPVPGDARLSLSSRKAATAAPGKTPVTIAAPSTRGKAASGQAHVTLLDQKTARNAGITGVVLTADASTAGTADVTVDYSGFASAIGGGWAQRLRLVQLPACALSTPGKPECRTRQPLKTDNDLTHRTVTAQVQLAAPTAGNVSQLTRTAAGTAPATTVLAVTATGAGSGQSPKGTGNYSATALSPSSSWQAGGSSGSFTWSYDFTLPPAAAGPVPPLALSYDSGSVDGRTATTNNQGTPVGEGFGLTESYIERTYNSCDDDGHDDIFDQCWKYDNARLVLNGRSSGLVKDKTSGNWRLENDDASTVTRSTGADNGDDDGEYWTVTTGDGTKYVFGKDKLDGAAAQRTNSAWTVPVFGDDSGEPGYSGGSSFADRSLNQAWRWNLDYVEDPRGNAVTYWYTKETNYYKKNKSTTANASYVRGGHLDRIEYGLRKGALFTDKADAEVTFGYAERCTAENCSSLTKDTADNWPDVPFDALCTKDDDDCDAAGPSFFTRKRLTGIDTFSYNATSNAYDAVDSWALTQEYLDGGDIGDSSDQVLTLKSLKRTGKAGDTAIGVNPVSFTYHMRPNRVDATDDILPLTRPRVSTVTSETGAITTVTLSAPECVRGQVLSAPPDSNTRSCYPQFWHINGAENAAIDWFHKYRVLAVNVSDPAGNNEALEYAYSYSGAAWHHSDDPFTPKNERTWSDWRGYRQVTTLAGATTTTRSKTVSLYLQGMDGDKNKDGSTKSVTVAPLAQPALGAASQADSDQYAGMLRQEITYDGATAISATVNDPWSKETARQSPPEADDRIARYVRTEKVHSYTYLTTPQSWRERQTKTSFDAYGMQTTAEDSGLVGKNGDETCTRIWYARNPAAGITSLVSRTRTVAGQCATKDAALDLPAAADRRGDVLADAATVYDTPNATTWSATQKPTKGQATWVGRPTGYAATADLDGDRLPSSWQTVATTAYDALGRPLSVTDTAGNMTSTAYTPADAGPLSKTITTGPAPKQYKSVDFLDPRRGLTLRSYDINLKKTELDYDALGRLTDVWLPNRIRGSQAPNTRYGYHLDASKPSWVSTSTLKNDGDTYNTAYTLYDALLRPLQTQSPTPLGGRLLTDTRYDTRGLAYETYADIFDSTATPNGTYARAEYGGAPKQSETVFDGAGRPTTGSLYVFGVKKWSTSTTYTGDSVATTALQGGSARRTITDVRGQTTETREYAGVTPADSEFGTSPGTSYTSTRFTYAPDGKQLSITGPDDSTWSYVYDLFGRQTRAVDPDKGTTTSEYNALDQVVRSTDSRGSSVLTAYDELGRPTGTWANSKTDATQLTGYTYDTLLKGQPTSSTRYVGGKAGSAYTSTVTAYDTLGRATRTQLELPSGDPFVKAGAPSTLPVETYYNLQGDVSGIKEPAAGGLESEPLSYHYDGLGDLVSFGGSTGYLLDVSYSQTAQPQQLTLGTGGSGNKSIYLTNTYETGTDRLTRSHVTDQTHPYALQDTNYTYDESGNITAISDPTNLGGTSSAETQCFTYDAHQRLTEAWTPASQKCTDTRSASALSGPAPYWNSYTYNAAGQRLTGTVHKTTGDTRTSYCYTKPGQPHTMTGTTTGTDCKAPERSYVYDAAGNTLKRPGTSGTQDLLWSPEGRLAKLAEAGTSTNYLYDAAGNLLIRSADNGERVLYISATELHLRADGTLWAQRRYTAGDITAAVRSNESGTGKLTYLAGDHQGTSTLTIAPDASQAFTKRYTTPFGEDRGKPQYGPWPDDKGFLGKTRDTNTGLTHIGAREYDPSIGQFLSVDPVLDTTDAQSLNGYSYADNSPVTHSDPTGAWLDDGTGHSESRPGGAAGPQQSGHPGVPRGGTGTGGCYYSCTSENDNGLLADARDATRDAQTQIYGAVQFYSGSDAQYNQWLDAYRAAMKKEYGRLDGIMDANTAIATAVNVCWAHKEIHCSQEMKNYFIDLNFTRITQFGLYEDAFKDINAVQLAGETSLGKALRARPCNCFLAGTDVLMADGSTKDIEKIHVGDKVKAADPETGRVGSRRVTRLISTDSDKYFNELSIATENGIEKLTATHEHPFWAPSEHKWVEAGSLLPGMTLLTAAGKTVIVTANSAYIKHVRTYNLTVEDLHTYYVLAGETPVLVHNSGGCPDLDALSQSGMRPAKGKTTHAGREYQKHMNRGDLPVVPGKELKTAGQDLLDDILTNPKTATSAVNSGNFAGGRRYIMPDPAGGRGIGATFDANGQFQYFGRY